MSSKLVITKKNLSLFFFMQGAVIREVDIGTECDECKEMCPGFEPHPWRFVNFPLSSLFR